MKAQDLVLNIAVNLGRLSRWVYAGNDRRLSQFLAETEEYLAQLKSVGVSEKFRHTFEAFEKKFRELKANRSADRDWAEDVLTWANILTHRAKFA